MEKKKMIIMGAVAFIGLLLGILVGISLNSFLKSDKKEVAKEPTPIVNTEDANIDSVPTAGSNSEDSSSEKIETDESNTDTNEDAPINDIEADKPTEITFDTKATADIPSTKIPYSAVNGMCMPDESGKYVKYEIIVDDLAWKNAFNDCKERGGHLLTINDMKEYDAISKFIFDQKADNNLFFLGGMREEKSDKYYWVDSSKTPIDSNALNEDKAWCKSLWAAGEPSYYDNHENDERYMMMYFSKTENKWLWCDVINDYIGMSENDQGRLAYICEYE